MGLPNGLRYRRLGRKGLGNEKLPKLGEKPQKRAESQPSGAPNQDGGPSFFPKETVKRPRHERVYSQSAGLEAVQSNGDAHCRSPAVHLGRWSN